MVKQRKLIYDETAPSNENYEESFQITFEAEGAFLPNIRKNTMYHSVRLSCWQQSLDWFCEINPPQHLLMLMKKYLQYSCQNFWKDEALFPVNFAKVAAPLGGDGRSVQIEWVAGRQVM